MKNFAKGRSVKRFSRPTFFGDLKPAAIKTARRWIEYGDGSDSSSFFHTPVSPKRWKTLLTR